MPDSVRDGLLNYSQERENFVVLDFGLVSSFVIVSHYDYVVSLRESLGKFRDCLVDTKIHPWRSKFVAESPELFHDSLCDNFRTLEPRCLVLIVSNHVNLLKQRSNVLQCPVVNLSGHVHSFLFLSLNDIADVPVAKIITFDSSLSVSLQSIVDALDFLYRTFRQTLRNVLAERHVVNVRRKRAERRDDFVP